MSQSKEKSKDIPNPKQEKKSEKGNPNGNVRSEPKQNENPKLPNQTPKPKKPSSSSLEQRKDLDEIHEILEKEQLLESSILESMSEVDKVKRECHEMIQIFTLFLL